MHPPPRETAPRGNGKTRSFPTSVLISTRRRSCGSRRWQPQERVHWRTRWHHPASQQSGRHSRCTRSIPRWYQTRSNQSPTPKPLYSSAQSTPHNQQTGHTKRLSATSAITVYANTAHSVPFFRAILTCLFDFPTMRCDLACGFDGSTNAEYAMATKATSTGMMLLSERTGSLILLYCSAAQVHRALAKDGWRHVASTSQKKLTESTARMLSRLSSLGPFRRHPTRASVSVAVV